MPILFSLLKFIAFFLTCTTIVSCASKGANKNEYAQHIRSEIMTLDNYSHLHSEVITHIKKHYTLKNFQPIWVSSPLPLSKYITILLDAHDHGLKPEYYFYSKISQLSLAHPSAANKAKLDVLLTAAYLSFAHDLERGHFNPQLLHQGWALEQKEDVRWKQLSRTPVHLWPNKLIEIQPQPPEYQLMKKELAHLNQFTGENELLFLSFEKDDTSFAIERLAKWLKYLGFDHGHSGFKYDKSLIKTVKAFQKKHNLIRDGMWGPKTARMLYGQTQKRIQKLKANMERLRWIPYDLGKTHVWVDIPNYKVTLNSPNLTFETTTIVGKTERQTPIFSDTMTHFVINPSWNVPNSIAKNDLLPIIQRDPNFLSRQGYQLINGARTISPTSVNWASLDGTRFPYRLIQKPGRGNALGKYKFMFPNKYSIYLHDTPSKHLFNQEELALSSGCGRLLQPELFAKSLLEIEGRDPELAHSNEQKTIHLKHPIPVYLTYFTLWPDKQGRLLERKDIYNKDAPLLLIFS
jgi:L,D-transpeptidase YcbB